MSTDAWIDLLFHAAEVTVPFFIGSINAKLKRIERMNARQEQLIAWARTKGFKPAPIEDA